jgi:hypothetical protein
MGCGSSRSEAKRVRKGRGKEFDENGVPIKNNEASGVGEIHKMFAAGQERVLESRVFNLPAASAHGNSEGLTKILPEYMLNPQAKQHETNLQQRYSELPLSQKQNNSLAHTENLPPQVAGTNYDGFSASIKYSLGLASIMNKYNIGSTNDIAEYKNNNIFIKTKKTNDEPKRPLSGSNSIVSHKSNGIRLPPIDGKEKSISPGLNPALPQLNLAQAGVTNTLIFVQKKEKPKSIYMEDRDLLSTLISMNVRPTQYFLSSVDLQHLEGEQKQEMAAEDPNQRLKHVMLGTDKEKKRKKLYQLADVPENPEYARDLLDAAFAEREHEEAKGIKKNKDNNVPSNKSGGVLQALIKIKDAPPKKSNPSSLGGSKIGGGNSISKIGSMNKTDNESVRGGRIGQD